MIQKKELEEKLIVKALKNEAFRKQLIDNPKVIIEQEMRMKIPESILIKIVEEDPQTIYLVLPYVPEREEGTELSEIEMENVAGGFSTWPYCTQDDGCVWIPTNPAVPASGCH